MKENAQADFLTKKLTVFNSGIYFDLNYEEILKARADHLIMLAGNIQNNRTKELNTLINKSRMQFYFLDLFINVAVYCCKKGCWDGYTFYVSGDDTIFIYSEEVYYVATIFKDNGIRYEIL